MCLTCIKIRYRAAFMLCFIGYWRHQDLASIFHAAFYYDRFTNLVVGTALICVCNDKLQTIRVHLLASLAIMSNVLSIRAKMGREYTQCTMKWKYQWQPDVELWIHVPREENRDHWQQKGWFIWEPWFDWVSLVIMDADDAERSGIRLSFSEIRICNILTIKWDRILRSWKWYM